MTTLSSLWQWLMGEAPRPVARRRVVLVAGGASGVGTSSVTALLSASAARVGHSVLLVDGAGGGIGDLLGAGAGNGAVAGAPDRATDDLTPLTVTQGTALLPASALGASGSRAPRLRRMAALCAQHDLALIDAGSRLRAIRELCGALGDMPRHGDRLLVVTTTEAASIASAYALIKSALSLAPRLRVDLLVNRAEPAHAAAVAEHVQEGVKRFLRRPIGFAGSIPESAETHGPQHLGAPLHDMHGDTSAALAAHEVLGRLLHSGRTVPPLSPPLAQQLQEA